MVFTAQLLKNRQDVIEALQMVYNSFISEKIDDYNSSAGITEKSARKHWGIEDREIRWIIPEYMKKVIKILIYYKNLVDSITPVPAPEPVNITVSKI